MGAVTCGSTEIGVTWEAGLKKMADLKRASFVTHKDLRN
jgi:hypothetical protein